MRVQSRIARLLGADGKATETRRTALYNRGVQKSVSEHLGAGNLRLSRAHARPTRMADDLTSCIVLLTRDWRVVTGRSRRMSGATGVPNKVTGELVILYLSCERRTSDITGLRNRHAS